MVHPRIGLVTVLMAAAPLALAADVDGDGCDDAHFDATGACVAQTAWLAETVTTTAGTFVGEGASVGPFVALDDAYIGPRAVVDGWLAHSTQPLSVGAGTVVGRRTVVGVDHLLGPDTLLDRAVVAGPRLTTGTNVAVGYGSDLGANVTLDDGALVGSSVSLGDFTHVGPGAIIARGATVQGATYPAARSDILGIVGPGVTLGSGVFVASTVRIRKDATVHSGARLMPGAHLGRDAVVEEHAVVYGTVSANAQVPARMTVPLGVTVPRGQVFSGPLAPSEVCSGGVDDDDDGLIDCLDSECFEECAPFMATGGTITQVDGMTIHTFTTDGVFTPTKGGTVEVLLVGGGGAGGSGLGAGGGGGAVLHIPSLDVTDQAYSITIGQGGIGGPNGWSVSGSGQSTTAFGEMATGGAGGLGAFTSAGPPVGFANGGGSAQYSANIGIGVVPPAGDGVLVYAGHDGGRSNQVTGGGAGAGEDGESPSGWWRPAGAGGHGVMVDITGSDLFWAGGGGGSTQNRSGGNGGLGGGGGGSTVYGASVGLGGGSALHPGGDGSMGPIYNNLRGGDAGANTGGGGGGGNHAGGQGGDGGSGIVIVRY